MAAILDFWFWYHGNSGKLSYLLLLRKLISGLTDCKLKEHVLILNYFKNLGGGGLPNKYDGYDRRNCWKTPLKITNMGVGPANFTP